MKVAAKYANSRTCGILRRKGLTITGESKYKTKRHPHFAASGSGGDCKKCFLGNLSQIIPSGMKKLNNKQSKDGNMPLCEFGGKNYEHIPDRKIEISFFDL